MATVLRMETVASAGEKYRVAIAHAILNNFALIPIPMGGTTALLGTNTEGYVQSALLEAAVSPSPRSQISQVEEIGFFWIICLNTCNAVSGSTSISTYSEFTETRNSR